MQYKEFLEKLQNIEHIVNYNHKLKKRFVVEINLYTNVTKFVIYHNNRRIAEYNASSTRLAYDHYNALQ